MLTVAVFVHPDPPCGRCACVNLVELNSPIENELWYFLLQYEASPCPVLNLRWLYGNRVSWRIRVYTSRYEPSFVGFSRGNCWTPHRPNSTPEILVDTRYPMSVPNTSHVQEDSVNSRADSALDYHSSTRSDRNLIGTM